MKKKTALLALVLLAAVILCITMASTAYAVSPSTYPPEPWSPWWWNRYQQWRLHGGGGGGFRGPYSC